MNIQVPREQVEAFCRRWKIREFALFGSVLHEDFRPDSDVDVLVEFSAEATHTLFDRAEMVEELKEIFGREVDLVRKDRISNPLFQHHVLDNHRVLYAA